MSMRFNQRVSQSADKEQALLSPSQLENALSNSVVAGELQGSDEELTKSATGSLSASDSASCPSWLCFWASQGKPVNHIDMVLRLTLITNIIIVLVMTGIAISTHSLALLSSLVENMIDLFVQGLLWYAAARFGKKQDHAKFPAGTSRFEPITVIVAASVMALVSVMMIRESCTRLVEGIRSDDPEVPKLSPAAITISASSVIIKVGLMFYGKWVLRAIGFSSAVDAIRQDNRNDIVSNSFALLSYILAAVEPKLWFFDSGSAILIFLIIMYEWSKMAKDQVMQLVGVCASDEFITEVRDLCARHHPMMELDILRAYHFGNKYLVEIEVILPPTMSVKDAHEIAIQLQFKVEQLCDVERAFVHVDYQSRTYDEHVVSREEDALLVYTAGTHGSTPTLAYEELTRLEPPSLRVSLTSSKS